MQELHTTLRKRGEALVRVGEDFGPICVSEHELEQSLHALNRAAASLNADAVEYLRCAGASNTSQLSLCHEKDLDGWLALLCFLHPC